MSGKVGVCSWSVAARSPGDLAAKVLAAGVTSVHLALDPLRAGPQVESETIGALRGSGIGIGAGMMAFRGEDYSTLESIRRTGGVSLDVYWEANLAAAAANAAIAARNGIGLTTLHAGFIPHERGPVRETMLARLRAIADTFAEQGVRIAFETGQESARTLLEALDDLDRPAVGVNFDPANMILYGMGDPIEAVRALAPRILQVHIKDAIPAAKPGTWGREVVVGTGAVNWPDFFRTLREENVHCNFMIEREAGQDRLNDIIAARELIERRSG